MKYSMNEKDFVSLNEKDFVSLYFWFNDDDDEDITYCDECEFYGCFTCPHCDAYCDSEF